MIPAAETLMADFGSSVRNMSGVLYERAVTHGCTPYVKTIYVGFTYESELVAALYPHADHVEIALALPEDHTSGILVDATHLTWKTLPVAALVRTEQDLAATLVLLGEAFRRVEGGSHDVERSNEHFQGRERRITSPKLFGA